MRIAGDQTKRLFINNQPWPTSQNVLIKEFLGIMDTHWTRSREWLLDNLSRTVQWKVRKDGITKTKVAILTKIKGKYICGGTMLHKRSGKVNGNKSSITAMPISIMQEELVSNYKAYIVHTITMTRVNVTTENMVNCLCLCALYTKLRITIVCL